MKTTGTPSVTILLVLVFCVVNSCFPEAVLADDGLWPPRGALHKDYNLTRMGPEVALRADCNGVPVYGFGYTYIYGLSPDFIMSSQLQAGNTSPVKKLVPKKSWEISSNMIGATPPRMPRTARSDFQPLLGIHLIDGDPETYWSCRGQNQADVEPAWARIDLAYETIVNRIIIVPREDNNGMPGHLTIKVSRDGWHWETVYDNPNQPPPQGAKPQEFNFDPRPVKQVWIIGQNNPYNSPWVSLHAFSIAEVQVLNEQGENMALVSRGAGVTVSSFETYIASYRETHQTLWPAHYDLGVEWVRINYAGSVLNWRMVEREKGVYEIDPEADAAISQTVKNGCKIIFGLGFTNWLYATKEQQPDRKQEKQMFHTNEFAVPFPSPEEPQMLEGFKSFVRFVVEYYKDRVDYFEIWNEQSAGYGGWGGASPELFTKWVQEVSVVIKQTHPGAKVIMGSLSGFVPRREVGLDWLERCMKAGIAPYIDAIGWHGYYGVAPNDKDWQDYAKHIQEAKKMAESYGFRGEYMHTEWCIFSPYPDNSGVPKPLPWITELVKAKHMARFAIMNIGLNVHFFWNETWCDGHIDRDVGLFRNTFSAEPFCPTQPQPSYYVLRTLCTVFDGARPVEMTVAFSNSQKSFECWTFVLPNGERLVSISQTEESKDKSTDYRTDIIISGNSFKNAAGIDVLNGTEQNLIVSEKSGNTIISDISVRDYPVVIRLSN